MTLEELSREIPRAIAVMYAACGVNVTVSPVEDGDGDKRWVAVPDNAIKVESNTAA